jgi:dihydroxyacetone kinase
MGRGLREAILAAADALEASREALCALDAETGDGDHGVTMTIGARNVRRQLEGYPGGDPPGVVRAAAMGMAGAGGAIGPLYGRGLLAVADVLQGAPGQDVAASGRDRGALDEHAAIELLRRCAEAAAEAVEALGHARPGDKTVLDALRPVAAALAEAERAGRSLATALDDARAAARSGAAGTAGMAASVGRSARFGERSRGTPDPGASSFAIVIDALVTSALAQATPAPGKPA